MSRTSRPSGKSRPSCDDDEKRTKNASMPNAHGLLHRGEPNQLGVTIRNDEPIGRTLARHALEPIIRNANTAASFAAPTFGKDERLSIVDNAAVLQEQVDQVTSGDLGMASRILTSQAVFPDAMFTEFSRRSAHNMGEYLEASERYMRLALKAQSNCRATLEALAKLHQPREQTVRYD